MRYLLLAAILYPFFIFGQTWKNQLILTAATGDSDTFNLVKVKSTRYKIESDSTYEIRFSNETRAPRYYEADTLRTITPVEFVNVYTITPGFLQVAEAKVNLGEVDSSDIKWEQLYLIIWDNKYCIRKMEAYRSRDDKVCKIIIESGFNKEYATVCDIFNFLPIKESDEFFITTCEAYDAEIGKKITVNLNLYFKIKYP